MYYNGIFESLIIVCQLFIIFSKYKTVGEEAFKSLSFFIGLVVKNKILTFSNS